MRNLKGYCYKCGKKLNDRFDRNKNGIAIYSGMCKKCCRLNKKLSETTKKKIGDKNRGKKKPSRTLEHRMKLRPWLGKCGEKSPFWKGGITKIDKLVRGMREYRQWRSDVFTRDGWRCKTCDKNGCYVTAHHIKGLNKIIIENDIKDKNDARKCDLLWDINNGITLCEDCHSFTDNYRGRANHK